MKYVAFLRGINVGGNHKVPMKDLQKVFFDMGFTDVKTLLNSGNVLFEGDEIEVSLLQKKIGEQLENAFGFRIDTFVFTQKNIKEMVERNPFKNITVTAETRLYVTFFPDAPKSNLKIPYESSEKNFRILEVSDNAIFSVLLLSEKFHTINVMEIIGKEYGKNVTTRNWNTVVKMAEL
jgi:uncharacterized protein (DUF1697 family)